MQMLFRLCTISLLVSHAAPRDHTDEAWVGRRIVAGNPDAKLRIGASGIGKAQALVMTVEQMRGEWLWVYDGRRKGYILKNEVVRLTEGVDYFTKMIQKTPGSAWAYRQRAAVHADVGDFDSALKDYAEVLKLDSKDTKARLNRAAVWAARGELDKAIADCDEVITLDPKDATAYLVRGDARVDKGELDLAMSDYQMSLELDPKDPVAYAHRGMLWRAKGEYDKAIGDYIDSIWLNPDDPLVYCSRGNAWAEKRQYARAVLDYDRAIRLDPKCDAAFVGRGHAYASTRQYAKALADYSMAISINDKEPSNHEFYAWLLATCPDARIRNGKRAIESAKKACELSAWRNPGFISTLAAGFAEEGDFESAIKWQKKAIDLEPKIKVAQGLSRLKLYEQNKPYRDEE